MNQKRLAAQIHSKLPGEARTGKESHIWVVVDGVKAWRVTCPKGHSGDVKRGTLKAIRDQMRLSEEQLEDFVQCRMSKSDYEAHARQVIQARPPQPAAAPPGEPRE